MNEPRMCIRHNTLRYEYRGTWLCRDCNRDATRRFNERRHSNKIEGSDDWRRLIKLPVGISVVAREILREDGLRMDNCAQCGNAAILQGAEVRCHRCEGRSKSSEEKRDSSAISYAKKRAARTSEASGQMH